MSQRALMIGLGNPGSDFQETYHNVGQLFIDHVSNRKNSFKKDGLFSYQLSGAFMLIKTTVFMTESGLAVKAALKRFGNSTGGALIIVHDDSDLVIGNYKFSLRQGAAGHKGVASIIKTLGHQNFRRLRIGIRPVSSEGTVKSRRLKAGDFVLRRISKSDQQKLYSVFDDIIRNVMEKVARSPAMTIEVSGNDTSAKFLSF